MKTEFTFYGNFPLALFHPDKDQRQDKTNYSKRSGMRYTKSPAKQAPSRAQKRSRRIARGGSKRR